MEKNSKETMMKSIVFVLIIISIVVILNNIYVNTVLNNYIVYRQEESYKKFMQDKSDKIIEYAIMGDSHPVQAINPEYLPGSFNLATSGQKYGKTYFKLKRVLEQDNVKINNILLVIDLHTFSTNFDREPNWLNDVYLYSKFTPNSELKVIYTDDTLLLLGRYFPSIGHGVDFIQLFAPLGLQIINKGWIQNDNDFSKEDHTDEIHKLMNEVYLTKERISSVTIGYFIRTLELAEQNNIRIFFIKYPISKEYHDIMQEYDINNDEYYDEIFRVIEKVLGEGYYVLDYYDLYFNNSGYFADSDHLNTIGSELFTKRVYEDLQNATTPISSALRSSS